MGRSRPAWKLSDSLHRQLNMYALAASAAGVGALALASPAEAKVVYTKVHHYVLLHHPLGLDLNRDGIVDFRITRNRFYDTQTAFATEVFAVGVSRNRVGGVAWTATTSGSGQFYIGTAYALPAGRQVGPQLHFPDRNPATAFMAIRSGARYGTQSYFCGGQWNNIRSGYLGLKFNLKGKIHYGWARLNEFCNRHGGADNGAQTLLTGYAYETIPNKAIIAGQTHGPDVITTREDGLGHLARGATARQK